MQLKGCRPRKGTRDGKGTMLWSQASPTLCQKRRTTVVRKVTSSESPRTIDFPLPFVSLEFIGKDPKDDLRLD